MDLIDVPIQLKLDRKKQDFIDGAKQRLLGVRKENILEIVIVVMNMAEEYFESKKNKKLGPIKKECVIKVCKSLDPTLDENTVAQMIETLVHTKNIKKMGFLTKLWRYLKKRFTGK